MTLKKSLFDIFVKVVKFILNLNRPTLFSCAFNESIDLIYVAKTSFSKIKLACPNRLNFWRAQSFLTKEPDMIEWINTFDSSCTLLDVGANADCKPDVLYQFGILGSLFSKHVCGIKQPKVSLLNLGEEKTKGNMLTQATYRIMQGNPDYNFIGNIEGKEVYRGNADVIVCDGFIGNVALKISESLAEMIGTNLKLMFQSNWVSKLGYLLLKPQLIDFKKKVDHSETGGALLLGLNGVVIIAHGSSSPKAIKNAINRAQELSEKKIIDHIKEDIELNLSGVENSKETIWKQIKNIAFGSEQIDDKEDNNPQVKNPEPKET